MGSDLDDVLGTCKPAKRLWVVGSALFTIVFGICFYLFTQLQLLKDNQALAIKNIDLKLMEVSTALVFIKERLK